MRRRRLGARIPALSEQGRDKQQINFFVNDLELGRLVELRTSLQIRKYMSLWTNS